MRDGCDCDWERRGQLDRDASMDGMVSARMFGLVCEDRAGRTTRWRKGGGETGHYQTPTARVEQDVSHVVFLSLTAHRDDHSVLRFGVLMWGDFQVRWRDRVVFHHQVLLLLYLHTNNGLFAQPPCLDVHGEVDILI